MSITRRPFKLARRLDLRSTQCLLPCIIRKAAGQETKGRLSAVLATEAGILRQDDFFGAVVPEILLMEGFEQRENHTSIPLLLSPKADTVRNIVGSIRSMRVVDNQLLGVIYFASDAKAQAIEGKVRDGHLTNLELTTQPLDGVRIDRGQVWRGLTGPCNAITRWFPIYANFTSHSGDPLTKVQISRAKR